MIEVLDHGAGAGVPWIAYEYAPDGSVRDRLSRGALAVAEAVAEAVARALAAAHAKGIVHRDVKPENVLVTPGQVYKLTDFGVARWAGKGSISTAAGMVLGTPAYLAPEVLRGQEPGPESDLYALAQVRIGVDPAPLGACPSGHDPRGPVDRGIRRRETRAGASARASRARAGARWRSAPG